MGKDFWKSKTLWFGLLLAVVSIAGIFGFDTYQPDAQSAEIIGLVVSAFVICLRLLTKEPIVKG